MDYSDLTTTRYRSRNLTHDRVSQWKLFTKNDNTGIDTNLLGIPKSDGIDAEIVSDAMWDVSDSGAITSMKMGEVVMNDMRQETTTIIRNIPGSGIIEGDSDGAYTQRVEIEKVHNYESIRDQVFPLPFVDITVASDVGRMCDQALTRLHSEIGKSPYDWLASMAEIPKTVKTIHRCFSAAQYLFNTAKKGHLKYIKGAITAYNVADVYLEVRYGLRPLIYELKQAIEALDTYGEKHRLNLSFYDSQPQVRTELPEIGGGIGSISQAGGLYMYSDIVDTYDAAVHVGAILKFKTETQGSVDILGFDNILETALELYPLSFMADWFINLSDYLSQWTPELNVIVEGTYLTLTETKTRLCRSNRMYALLYGIGGLQWFLNESGKVPASSSLIEKTRTRRYANPQKPWFPRANIRLDGLKVVDMIAIFGGFFTDFKRWKI